MMEDLIKKLQAENKKLKDYNSYLEKEAGELSDLIIKLDKLLTLIVNELKGDPGELSMHGYSDLPEIVYKLKQKISLE